MSGVKPEISSVRFEDPPAAGLVGAWAFGEGSSDLMADVGHQGLHGTMMNASGNGWESFEVGRGVSFDGLDDYMSLPDGLFLDRPAGTVLMLVRPNPAGVGFEAFVSDRNPTQEPYFEFTIFVGVSLVLSIDDGKSVESVFVVPVTFGSWMVVAAEWGPTGKRIYLNGAKVAENTSMQGGTASTGGSVALGRRINSRYLGMDVALFVMWDRAIGDSAQARMAAEPWSLFRETSGRRFVPSAVGAYVRLMASVGAA